MRDGTEDTLATLQQQPRPPEFSDESLALRFAEKYGAGLRYVAAWSRWLEWDGVQWKFDDTLRAFDLARAICRAASAECARAVETRKLAATIASARTVAAIERLAKADRRLAAAIDQWDSDPWMLNTPEGTVDLRTGKMTAHQRSDYCTKSTAVSPAGNCPLWLDFLEQITGGDRKLQDFLRRMAGYALTGSTQEHALFFLYGTGANGKSTFISTIAGVLRDYAATAPMETFIASNSDHHPTDLAGLRGARLVAAQETEEGRRWAESRIKTLTGGDRISARFMRQDFFQFTPQFKLVIAGNHKPGLRGVDEAMRRRMNLLPFTVTFPPEVRDEKLAEKLRGEWPGILQWMIDGCLEWAGEGLAQPEAVRKATDDYLRAEDAIAEWISECCTSKPNDTATSTALFRDWARWAERAGEFVGSQKRFSQGLEDRGFAKSRAGDGRVKFAGIGLLAEPPVPPPWERDE